MPDGAVPFPIPSMPPGGVPEGMVPEGVAPEGAVPFIPPIAVLFIAAMGVPEGVPVAACSSAVTDADGVPDDEEEVVELCVHPAIRIPAIRRADPIRISILLFFMGFVTTSFFVYR